MSNVNFLDLPVNNGLLYAFDCNTYSGGDVWVDFCGRSNFALTNAVKDFDGAVDFITKSGTGTLTVSESYNDSTEYYIMKTIGNGTVNNQVYTMVMKYSGENTRHYLYHVGNADPNLRYFGAFEKVNDNNRNYVVSTVSAATNYHIVAVNRVGTTHRVFIDGILAITQDGMPVIAPTKYALWTTVLIKCAVIFKAPHTDIEILQNSNWLLEQYGLKEPSKDSRLAGTDAVAIAYAIARNQESASALQELKRAYRDGIMRGEDPIKDNDDPTPPPIQEETEEELPGDGVVFDVDETGNVSEPYVGSLANGVCVTGNFDGYLKITLDNTYETGVKDELGTYGRGRLVYELFDGNGSLIERQDVLPSSLWTWYSKETFKTGKFNEQWVVKISIRPNEVGAQHLQTLSDGQQIGVRNDWSPSGNCAAALLNGTRYSTTIPISNNS